MSFLRMTGKGRSYNDWGYEDKSYGKSTGKGWGKSSYEDSWGGGKSKSKGKSSKGPAPRSC